MTLIAVASVSGSPGVTTAALGLAAYWPLDLTRCWPRPTRPAVTCRSCSACPTRPAWSAWPPPPAAAAGPDLLWRHAQWLTPRPGGRCPARPAPSQAPATASPLAAGSWYAPVTAAAAAGR